MTLPFRASGFGWSLSEVAQISGEGLQGPHGPHSLTSQSLGQATSHLRITR